MKAAGNGHAATCTALLHGGAAADMKDQVSGWTELETANATLPLSLSAGWLAGWLQSAKCGITAAGCRGLFAAVASHFVLLKCYVVIRLLDVVCRPCQPYVFSLTPPSALLIGLKYYHYREAALH